MIDHRLRHNTAGRDTTRSVATKRDIRVGQSRQGVQSQDDRAISTRLGCTGVISVCAANYGRSAQTGRLAGSWVGTGCWSGHRAGMVSAIMARLCTGRYQPTRKLSAPWCFPYPVHPLFRTVVTWRGNECLKANGGTVQDGQRCFAKKIGVIKREGARTSEYRRESIENRRCLLLATSFAKPRDEHKHAVTKSVLMLSRE